MKVVFSGKFAIFGREKGGHERAPHSNGNHLVMLCSSISDSLSADV